MPCFRPLQEHLIRLTFELIDKFDVKPKFLEIGCGDGALTCALAGRKWAGAAIDLSPDAVEATRMRLEEIGQHRRVSVHQMDVLHIPSDDRYSAVFIYDVLEHIEDDRATLDMIADLLEEGGHLFVSVPIKMSQWRWDDEQYGHIRRYEKEQLEELLDTEQFEMLAKWDVTFPVIWSLRWLYTAILRPAETEQSTAEKTANSAFRSAAGSGRIHNFIENLPIWKWLLAAQRPFRNYWLGSNALILARRR